MMENPGKLIFGRGQAISLCGSITGHCSWCLPGATSRACVRVCLSLSLSTSVLAALSCTEQINPVYILATGEQMCRRHLQVDSGAAE